MKIPVNTNSIISAHNRINPFIYRTPILTSQSINRITNSEIIFKCENFQKVGAFKMRGATNAILSLPKSELKFGVATHSSGNHAAALAKAAQLQNIPAFIVMPQNAPKIKIEAVKSYGATIFFCEPTLEARQKMLEKIVTETGAYFIHPYNNWEVISGQATTAKELIEDSHGDLHFIVTPLGGGGLLSGTLLSAKYFGKKIRVIGAEPVAADDAFRSLKEDEILPALNPKTIADGLMTSLGVKTFSVIRQYVDRILTVSEESIAYALFLILERMKIVVEPSAAVPLAAIIENKELFYNKRVGIILSGGNLNHSLINEYKLLSDKFGQN